MKTCEVNVVDGDEEEGYMQRARPIYIFLHASIVGTIPIVWESHDPASTQL